MALGLPSLQAAREIFIVLPAQFEREQKSGYVMRWLACLEEHTAFASIANSEVSTRGRCAACGDTRTACMMRSRSSSRACEARMCCKCNFFLDIRTAVTLYMNHAAIFQIANSIRENQSMKNATKKAAAKKKAAREEKEVSGRVR